MNIGSISSYIQYLNLVLIGLEEDNYLPAKSLAVNQFLKELNNQEQNASTGM